MSGGIPLKHRGRRADLEDTSDSSVLKFTPSASDDLAQWYSLMVNQSHGWAQAGWGGHIVVRLPRFVHHLPSANETRAGPDPGTREPAAEQHSRPGIHAARGGLRDCAQRLCRRRGAPVLARVLQQVRDHGASGASIPFAFPCAGH